MSFCSYLTILLRNSAKILSISFKHIKLIYFICSINHTKRAAFQGMNVSPGKTACDYQDEKTLKTVSERPDCKSNSKTFFKAKAHQNVDVRQTAGQTDGQRRSNGWIGLQADRKAWLLKKCDFWKDRRQTKWSLWAAMLRRWHKKKVCTTLNYCT